MKPDRLTFEINEDGSFPNTYPYNGEFNNVKKELEDNLNKLIFDFENKYKVTVIFDEVDIANTTNRVDISLLIDLRTSIFPDPHQ
ncbi:hypothetical protein [Elizabethkingia miricola]|uniref:hypothetical protein n=1 Tax=Elizabethkingia miricola TaxID=172045 RepID=UPI002ACE7B89|nr:hypothetical protein [Elizabethkingia miricola]WQM39416.1 hypothetical protein U2S95_03955 [Elizabethkingia miricola]